MTTAEKMEKLRTCGARGRGVVEAALDKLAADPSAFPFDDPDRTRCNLDNIQFHPFYVEPGYEQPKTGIVVGNANHTWRDYEIAKQLGYDSPEYKALQARCKKESLINRVFKALDRLGYEFEWEDEWTTCTNCYGLVRNRPNCYGWQKYVYCDDNGEEVCGDCVKEDETEFGRYVEWLEGNGKRADQFGIDWEKAGYVLVKDDFEHGLHHDQDSDPNLVAGALKKAGASRFIFVIDSVGQFDLKFSVWIHKDEKHITDKVALTPDVTNGPSVSEAMKRGLQNAALVSAQLPDVPGAVKYVSITPQGEARGVNIPGEEFIEHGVTKALAKLHEEEKSKDTGSGSSCSCC